MTRRTRDGSVRTYVLDEQVGFLLRKAQQRHLAIFSGQMPDDLTPMQFAALVKLSEGGPCSQNSLGRQTAMDVATIKGVVTRLQARGLVDKTDNPDDRRMSLIALTAAGRATVDRLVPVAEDISRQTLEPLSPDERAHFMTLACQTDLIPTASKKTVEARGRVGERAGAAKADESNSSAAGMIPACLGRGQDLAALAHLMQSGVAGSKSCRLGAMGLTITSEKEGERGRVYRTDPDVVLT